jgi:hypothetical protein
MTQEVDAYDPSLPTVTLRFDVADNGPGIDPALHQKIFLPFEQAPSPSSHADIASAAGSGLGLTLCREFVELMHGQISVASRPGEGATFSFTCLAQLPAAETAEDRATSLQTRIYTSQPPEGTAEHVVVPPDNATHTPSPPPDSADILVVDDNPVNVFVLETQLRRLGFGCGVAHDGVEATEYVRTSLGLATAPEPSPSVLSVPVCDAL